MMKEIYLIDDDVVILMLCKHYLQRAGYKIKSFQSAELALEMINKKQPDVIIIDYGLPGISGDAFIRELNQRGHSDIPYIFITGQTDKVSLQKVKDTKPIAIFSKPFSPNKLVNTINRICPKV